MTDLFSAAKPVVHPAVNDPVPLIETRNLTRHFKVGGTFSNKRLHAVDDANIVINSREIVALVGESGSGKSTMARLLAQVYKPTSGHILYQGRPLASRSVFEGFMMPDKITIYQGPHERSSRTRAELEQMVADTVWHEIAHHFGMDEPRVRRAERQRRS